MKIAPAISIALSGLFCAAPLHALADELKSNAATQDEVNTYTGMSAISICTLNQLGVSLEKSLQASMQMFLSVIDGKHGGAIQGVEGGKKLPEKVLVNGGVAETIVKVDGICGKDFKGEDKTRLDKIKDEIKQAVSTQSTTIPKTK